MEITGLIFFGDSILAGTGASERDLSCAKLVKNVIHVPVSLRARNWSTTRDGLDRIQRDILSQKDLSHVVILFGNNDCWPGATGEPKISILETKANLIQIGQLIKGNNQVPLFCNLQPINGAKFLHSCPELAETSKKHHYDPETLHKQYSNAIKSIAKKLCADCIDIHFALEQQLDQVIGDDGIHPNDLGHRIIARTILETLKAIDKEINLSEDHEKNLLNKRSGYKEKENSG